MTAEQQGKLIIIEGIDGSGKSTQATRLKERLEKGKRAVHQTFEPTDGHVGRFIRQILQGTLTVSQETLAALFVADRLDHITHEKHGLRRMIENGVTVVCDRYYFSSYAYQSGFVDLEWVVQSNRLAVSLLKPDMHVFIDVPPEVCIERIRQRQTSRELFEHIEVMTNVREAFLSAFEKFGQDETIRVIPGEGTPEQIEALIWEAVRGICA